MFVLHFMLKDVYVNNLMDWVSFFGWMSLFSLAGFLLVGFGLQLIIKSTKTETYNQQFWVLERLENFTKKMKQKKNRENCDVMVWLSLMV